MVELVGVDLGDVRPSSSSGASAIHTASVGEREPGQGVRPAAGDRGDDLLHERPRVRGCADEHLPAGLHVDAPVDEQRCIVGKPRIGHECWTLTTATCYART